MLGGTTRLRLFRFVVKADADAFIVIRCDTGHMLQTTAEGIESIRLLQSGLTIDAVRAALGGRYGCPPAEVDITPLVECLFAEQFVAEVDGERIAHRSQRLRDVLTALWSTFVEAPVTSAVVRAAPLPLAIRFVMRARPGTDDEILARIAANMRRVHSIAGADADRLARANYTALRRFYFERVLLAGLPPARLDRWIRRRVQIEGLKRIGENAARGRGTLLCAFHSASYSMIPFALAAHGCSPLVLMENSATGIQQIERRLAEIRAAGYSYRFSPFRSAGVFARSSGRWAAARR
jgi:hypothetical protein